MCEVDPEDKLGFQQTIKDMTNINDKIDFDEFEAWFLQQEKAALAQVNARNTCKGV